MARTNIAAQALLGSYPLTPLSADSADLLFEPADIYDGNETNLINDRTVIVAKNTGVGAHVVSILSQKDPTYGRKGDITEYSVAAGKTARFGPFKTVGWSNAGKLDFDADSDEIEFAVVTL